VINPAFQWRRTLTTPGNFPINLDLSLTSEYHSTSNSKTSSKSEKNRNANIQMPWCSAIRTCDLITASANVVDSHP